MLRSRTLWITLSFALSVASGLHAADTPPSTSRRPLPHPDILTLPPEESPAGASRVSSTPQPLPQSGEAVSPADRDEVSEPTENREIARRNSPRQENESQELSRRATASNRGLLRDLWPLLVVLGVIAAAAYMVKRFVPSRRLLGGSGALRIVSQTHLTAKHQLMLVRLGGRLVLLGVSPERINTLSIIDDPEQVAQILGDVASTQAGSVSRAFVESMQEETEAYMELPEEDTTDATRGQVRGLLKKVRTLAGKE